MTITRRVSVVIIAAAVFSASVRGQEIQRPASTPPYIDEQRGMTLDEAIARALAQEPGLRAARTDIDVARGQREQAGLRPNPTVMFERRHEPGGTDRLTSIGVDWPLDLFRREGRVQTADQEVAATQFGVADRERLLAADVRLQYGLAAAAAREVSVVDDLVETMRRQLTAVRGRASEGAIPPLDRDRMEVEVHQLQADRVRASGRADVAILHLKQLLGMAPEEPLTLREDIERLVARTAADTSSEKLMSTSSRPDVQYADSQLTTAEARADLAQREGRPDVSVFGNYMRMDAGFPQFGVGPSGGAERVRGQFNYVSVGAKIGLQLFNRNQGNLAKAQAERAGAQARLDAVTLAARSDVAAARIRDTRAREVVALYSEDTRTLARRNLDVVRQTFDLGRGTVFDVLTEQRRYLDFEQAGTTALREAWEAHAALKKALGEVK